MHYDRQHKALHYKQVEPKVTIDIKYTVKHRRTEVTITRLRLGHCLTNKRLNGYNHISSANCQHCSAVEDLEHLITCPHSNYLKGCRTNNVIELLKDPKEISKLAANIIASNRRI